MPRCGFHIVSFGASAERRIPWRCRQYSASCSHHALVVSADIPSSRYRRPRSTMFGFLWPRLLCGGWHHTREGKPCGESKGEEPATEPIVVLSHVLITS